MPDPTAFAQAWLSAWNARDLEALLALFDEDVVFTSPLAAKIVPGSDGLVRGKAALRAYWTAALAQMADLRFELTEIYAGVDSLVIGFRINGGAERLEVLRFRGDRVGEGHGTYRVMP
jgi:ketosteroid isomerase-like protein